MGRGGKGLGLLFGLRWGGGSGGAGGFRHGFTAGAVLPDGAGVSWSGLLIGNGGTVAASAGQSVAHGGPERGGSRRTPGGWWGGVIGNGAGGNGWHWRASGG
ncbi:hypothetical protein [Mycobacterium tuberculosis]|uniref:hypothetical protein n=1 Tax=Mycobacterium tuberculosis TaxID=1773 RepID=UPI0034592118